MFNLYQILSSFEDEFNRESMPIRQKAAASDKKALMRANDLCVISSKFSTLCRFIEHADISRSIDDDLKSGLPEDLYVMIEKFFHARNNIQDVVSGTLDLIGDKVKDPAPKGTGLGSKYYGILTKA